MRRSTGSAGSADQRPQAVLKARGGDSGINCAVCLSNYTSGDELRVWLGLRIMG